MIIRPSAFGLFTLICSLVSIGCGCRPENSPKGPDAIPRAHQAPPPQAAPGGVPNPGTGEGTTRTPLADAASALVGTWRCRGSIHGGDGAASPSEVSLQVALDLDAAWLKTEFVVTSGKYKYGFTSYRTFDPSRQWVNVIVDNMGGHAVSRSTNGATWTGESTGPMGTIQIRDRETIVSPNEMNMLGQYSPNGTSYNTGYDLSCRK